MIEHVPIVWAFDHPREAFQRARNAFVVGMGEGPGLGNTRIRNRCVVASARIGVGSRRHVPAEGWGQAPAIPDRLQAWPTETEREE